MSQYFSSWRNIEIGRIYLSRTGKSRLRIAYASFSTPSLPCSLQAFGPCQKIDNGLLHWTLINATNVNVQVTSSWNTWQWNNTTDTEDSEEKQQVKWDRSWYWEWHDRHNLEGRLGWAGHPLHAQCPKLQERTLTILWWGHAELQHVHLYAGSQRVTSTVIRYLTMCSARDRIAVGTADLCYLQGYVLENREAKQHATCKQFGTSHRPS